MMRLEREHNHIKRLQTTIITSICVGKHSVW